MYVCGDLTESGSTLCVETHADFSMKKSRCQDIKQGFMDGSSTPMTVKHWFERLNKRHEYISLNSGDPDLHIRHLKNSKLEVKTQ